MRVLHLTKRNFNAGSPFSCWLREIMSSEVNSALFGEPSKLFIKYKAQASEEIFKYVMFTVEKLDDYGRYKGLREIAVEYIRSELDPDFEKQKHKNKFTSHKRHR